MTTMKAEDTQGGGHAVDKGISNALNKELKAYQELKEQRARNKLLGGSEESHIQIMDKIFT